MKPLFILLGLAGAAGAAYLVIKKKIVLEGATGKKATQGAEPKRVKQGPQVEINEAVAVEATAPVGTEGRGATVEAVGRNRITDLGRRGMPGKRTIGSVIQAMMGSQGPEGQDRVRRSMGPSGSILAPKRVIRGPSLGAVAGANTRLWGVAPSLPGVPQIRGKQADQALSPAAQPALARGTGFALNPTVNRGFNE